MRDATPSTRVLQYAARDKPYMKAQASSSVKFTYEDFLLFPDDGKRHEIIDGEHYVTPSPNLKHQAASGNLFGLLWTHLRQIGRAHV